MTQTVRLVGEKQRQLAKALIDKAPQDAVVTIREASRTLDQSAYMWSLLSDISRAKPDGRRHTPEVWKSLMMHACGWEVQFEMGLNGQPFPTGYKSSRLTKAEMSDLLEVILEYAARKNVPLSEEKSYRGR